LSSRKQNQSAAALLRRGLAGVAAVGSLALAGCTDAAGYDLDVAMGKVPWLATMRKGVQLAPYEMPRLPAEGTVPIVNPHGDAPPPFTQFQLDSVGATLRNPFPVTEAFLARGEVEYERNCTVCHGTGGAGDGPVVGPNKFPFAPPVNGAATQARSDGYIYGVVRVGRGLMPAYGTRMTEADMWATVAYVRRLQGQAVPATGAQPAAPAQTETQTAPSAPPSPGAATDTAPAQSR